MFNLFTCEKCGIRCAADMIKVDNDLEMVCPSCHCKTQFTPCSEETIRSAVNEHLTWHLNACFGRDYAAYIPPDLISKIVDDIMESTSIHMEGVWNDDDVRLATGRVLLKGYIEGELQGA